MIRIWHRLLKTQTMLESMRYETTPRSFSLLTIVIHYFWGVQNLFGLLGNVAESSGIGGRLSGTLVQNLQVVQEAYTQRLQEETDYCIRIPKELLAPEPCPQGPCKDLVLMISKSTLINRLHLQRMNNNQMNMLVPCYCEVIAQMPIVYIRQERFPNLGTRPPPYFSSGRYPHATPANRRMERTQHTAIIYV